MTIRLLQPYGSDPAGKVISVSHVIALDLIHKNIATCLGNVDGWGRTFPTIVEDKMQRGEGVVTK